MRRTFIVLAAALAAAGCAPKPTSSEAPTSAAAELAAPAAPSTLPSASGLSLVSDPSQVCMVNNQFMGKPQIPVDVGGTTYYGCCEMCKGKLASDPSSRVAIDPVSKNEIDKAHAVMARDDLGTITYFESEANFAKYSGPNRVN